MVVTAGAGYIGSHTVLALEAGETVVVIDNLSTGVSADLPEGVTLFIGDAADENLDESVIAATRRGKHHAFCGIRGGAGLDARSARLLPQQHHDDAQPVETRR